MTASTRADRRDGGADRHRGGASKNARHIAEAVEITLEHARWRHLGWMAFGVIAGVLILLHLGLVGQMVGVVLLLMAARHGYHFTRTLLFPAGTLDIDRERAVLPLGLCRGDVRTFPLDQVEHAYLLRRAVPWTQTGPLLVVEAGGRAYVYPRDWFASEGDQQRVVRVVRHHLGQELP